MPLAPPQLAVQRAAAALSPRLSTRLPALARVAESFDEGPLIAALKQAITEVRHLQREQGQKRRTLEERLKISAAELLALAQEAEREKLLADVSRRVDAALCSFSVGPRVEEGRAAVWRDRLDRDLRGRVKLTEAVVGDELVYSLDPEVGPRFAGVLAAAIADGEGSWAEFSVRNLNEDLALLIYVQSRQLDSDLRLPLDPSTRALLPAMALTVPKAGERPWWRTHQLPEITLRRPDMPFFRELGRAVRSQVFMAMGLIGLVVGALGGDLAQSRGFSFGVAVAFGVPMMVLETLRDRRIRRERSREEVERAITGELVAWCEGRMQRASQRLRDELDWQLKVRVRDGWLAWHRAQVSGRLESVAEQRRGTDEARRRDEDELRRLEGGAATREIEAFLTAAAALETPA
jgi:hypothetical protein